MISWSRIAVRSREPRSARPSATSEEELLLAETPDGAGVALYLDPDLLRRLEGADPVGALTET